MTRQEEIIGAIKVLRKEVEVLTTRLKPAGTGHLHTAIGVINKRIDELIEEAMGPFFAEEDVYSGYQEHTEAMELSRLKRIQARASGRDDGVEHTEEYFDRGRNRAMEGEDFQHMTSADNDTWGGLSNRSMKQRSGRAVMTTSEMMQEELEPLPINTFK